jgi:hypothetical protein
MTKKSLISKIEGIIKSTSIFEGPTKKIVGTWRLFEYFTENKEELVHKKEAELKTENVFCVLVFEEGQFQLKSSIDIECLEKLQAGTWQIKKNFLYFEDEKSLGTVRCFQFAFDKDTLKLLKKNERGEIEFFGFFKPDNI